MGMGTMPPKRVIAKRPKHPFRRAGRRAVRHAPSRLQVTDVWIPNIPPGAAGHGNPHGDRRTPQPPLILQDAVDYVYGVYEGLKDADKGKFNEFLQMMQELKAHFTGSWDYLDVMVRVRDLFEGYTHLILGFNNFLPEVYRFIVCADYSVLIAVDVSSDT